jgi:hypothetical protein
MKLWLDDEREAPPGWEWARTYDEAVELCISFKFDTVSLDHDLGEEKTGYDFLCFLEDRHHDDSMMPIILIHTANPVGRQRMQLALASIKRRTEMETC